MRVLVADDDLTFRTLLEKTLQREGYTVLLAKDGREALQALTAPSAPPLAILNWVMPGLDGIEVCQKVRAVPTQMPPYILLLTSRDRTKDVVLGLESGADDYLTKPFHPAELGARLRVGQRIIELQRKLSDRIAELERALAQVHTLRGLLPICSYCKKIRDDHNYWRQIESYICEHSQASFTHSICPGCESRLFAPGSDS
ncbi:MAG TPA: response regulator [Bdellovibrionota bacterium]|nr:response regulator [Bdellovibrionota bacterium]